MDKKYTYDNIAANIALTRFNINTSQTSEEMYGLRERTKYKIVI